MLTVDEVGDVVHRPWTIEGVHGDEVLEGRGLQLAQVLLHPSGFELEGPDGLPLGVELVGLGIIDRDLVDVDLDTAALLDVQQGFLDDREGLEPEEVHLDQARRLDDRAFVLRHEHTLARGLILGGAQGDDVADIHLPDDDTAGMYARTADIPLEHLRILQRIVE